MSKGSRVRPEKVPGSYRKGWDRIFGTKKSNKNQRINNSDTKTNMERILLFV